MSSSVQPADSDARVSCVLDVYPEDTLDYLEEAVSAGRHFSYAIPYVVGQTIKKQLCLIQVIGYEYIDRGIWGSLYACIADSGRKVTTAQRHLTLTNFVRVSDVSYRQLMENIPEKSAEHLLRDFGVDFRTLPPRTGQQVWRALKDLSGQRAELEELEAHTRQINLDPATERAETLAAEKDATGLCLEIAGFKRSDILRSWAPQAGRIGDSFLRGLPQYRTYEDSAIARDQHAFPGWELIEHHVTGIAEFSNDQNKRLTIINANRNDLEKALGVDLIYFHRGFEAFTFVQYKMMDRKTKDGQPYHNPRSRQDYKELQRMRRLWHGVRKSNLGDSEEDYRLGLCPIFFKLCRRIVLEPDEGGIISGAYVPLDQWQKLVISPKTKGPRGGRRLGHFSLEGRYLTTTAFVELVQRGLVGTKTLDTHFVADIVERLVAEDHSVIYAVEQLRSRATRRS